MISNSGSDENLRISGGRAGDQTGKEWVVRTWYNRPWTCVLRHPDVNVRKKLAELSTKAANNNNIGYDQNQRMTYWIELQKVNFDPSKIKTPCESDCSAGVIANTKAVGHLLNISKLKNVQATYTGNMRAAFKAAGFEVLTDSKYLTSPDYLLRGDILLNDSHHTAVNLDDGSKVSTRKKTCKIVLNELSYGDHGVQVKAVQRILRELGYKNKDGKEITVDGKYGDSTKYAVGQFQKNNKISVKKGLGNVVGANTWKKLLTTK